jgi:integrase
MPRNQKYPGITKTSSGYRVRVTGVDRRTGKLRERSRELPAATRAEAVKVAEELREAIKSGGQPKVEQQTLSVYARSWLERKAPRLQSDNTRERYVEALEKHILTPPLGDLFVASITKLDLETWLAKWAATEYAPGKKYKHATINGWLRIAKELLQSAVVDLDLPRDPTLKVEPLPVDEVEGNTLSVEELTDFLGVARQQFPQWYAFLLLGFVTGARPGELRPLRWGEDFDPETGQLTIRRSQRRKYVGPTKTRKARVLLLPRELVDVLLWHRQRLVASGHPGAQSDLLFPSMGKARKAPPVAADTIEVDGAKRKSREYFRLYRRRQRERERAANGGVGAGGFISPSALDEPMREIARLAGIKTHITPKAMRRTFNDVARKAQVHDLVLRSVSGHRTTEMQKLYSTIDGEEKRAGLAKVISLYGGSSLVPAAVEQDRAVRAQVRSPVRPKRDSSDPARRVASR